MMEITFNLPNGFDTFVSDLNRISTPEPLEDDYHSLVDETIIIPIVQIPVNVVVLNESILMAEEKDDEGEDMFLQFISRDLVEESLIEPIEMDSITHDFNFSNISLSPERDNVISINETFPLNVLTPPNLHGLLLQDPIILADDTRETEMDISDISNQDRMIIDAQHSIIVIDDTIQNVEAELNKSNKYHLQLNLMKIKS